MTDVGRMSVQERIRRQCSAGNRKCTVSEARSSVTHATAEGERRFHLAANSAA